MKKKLWIVGGIVLVLALTVCMVYCSVVEHNLETKNEYFATLYHMVRDIDFKTGRLEDGILTLYDGERDPLMTIDVGDCRGVGRVMLRKDAARQVYFILGGSVDDEYGVLYVEGSCVNMDGMWSIKRMGGNSFYYQTRE